jgi:NAD(P)-dependent dehydrogenase (short-subunit alcohol dehydrogenase family)
MSELRYDDRVAVITGAARGLGRGYAHLLASRGAKVVVNDIGGSLKGEGVDAGPAETVVQEIKAAGGEAVACTDTVATVDGGKKIIQAAMDHYGRVDIIVHNAGNVRRGAMTEISEEDFFGGLAVHLHGGFHVARPAFPIMAKAGYGRMVMTSSVAGIYGNLNVVNYAVSKTGLLGLTNLISLEGAAVGVKANAILPGALTRMADGAAQLDTSAFPASMAPEYVAPMVAYLCHESCAVTGEYYIAMAGRMARAYFAETRGVVRDKWTIEQIAENLDAIRDEADSLVFPTATGFTEHISRTLQMAKAGSTK